MTLDDLAYTVLLLTSLLCGRLLSMTPPHSRRYFSAILGILFVALSCGSAIYHSLFVTFVSILIIYIRLRNFQLMVFVFCFSYLVFFRTVHLFGLTKPPSYANAVQLVLTLKLIGAAFEISDSLQRNKLLKQLSFTKDDKDSEVITQLNLEIKYVNVGADIVDLFTYSYCFIGLMTGPYFKYRVYLDCVRSQSNNISNISELMLKKAKLAVALGFCYFVVSHFFYIEYVKTDEFYFNSFFYRLLYMTIMFFVFRMRMYFAWVVSECVCMSASLGSYPISSKPVPGHGPTVLSALEDNKDKSEISFETIRNLSITGCEWAPSVRDGMRSWNMSVQYWLATFVYRRFPIKNYRTLVTMLVSAFWHGVHPGYYFSFLTIPFSLQGESSLEHLLGISTPSKVDLDHWHPYHFFKDRTTFLRWFYKMRVFDYCCMGFLLLEASSTLRYWYSIYFSVHIMILVLILLNVVLRLRTR